MYTKTMYKVFVKNEIRMGDIVEVSYKYKYYDNPIDAYNNAIVNDTLAEEVKVLTLEEPKNKVHIFCDGTTKTWRKIHSIGNDDYCKCEDNENVGEKCTTCGYMKYVGRQIDPRT